MLLRFFPYIVKYALPRNAVFLDPHLMILHKIEIFDIKKLEVFFDVFDVLIRESVYENNATMLCKVFGYL